MHIKKLLLNHTLAFAQDEYGHFGNLLKICKYIKIIYLHNFRIIFGMSACEKFYPLQGM